jgi:hypothetical protein
MSNKTDCFVNLITTNHFQTGARIVSNQSSATVFSPLARIGIASISSVQNAARSWATIHTT